MKNLDIQLAKSKYLKKQYIYKKNNQKLVYKFNLSENIERNYSQMLQDVFVLTVLNGKSTGTYVEIGSSHPKRINNTFLLENVYNWKGIGYEIDEHLCNTYNNTRKNICKLQNALTTNFEKDFASINLPEVIDYLQIDIEPAEKSFDCLHRLPLDKYRFNVITFETENYLEGDKYENLSREYLTSKGYKLVMGRVGRLGKFYEDWYIHEKIEEQFLKIFNSHSYNEIDPRDIFFSNFKINKLNLIFGTLLNLFLIKRDIYE